MDQDCYEKIDVGHYYGDLGIVFFWGGESNEHIMLHHFHVIINNNNNTWNNNNTLLFQVSWLNERSFMGINFPLVKKPHFQYFSMEQFGFLIFSTIQG